MKSVSAGLLALLATNQFYRAELWTITLNGGTVLRYSGAETDLAQGGHTFSATGVKIGRSGTLGKLQQNIGLEVGQLQFELYADPLDATAVINSIPALSFIRGGGLDGATVQLDVAFMPTWGDTSNGLVTMFFGRVSDVECGRTKAIVSVRDPRELLNIQMPRNLYQPGCVRSLYDAGCGLLAASFTTATTVTGSPTVSRVPIVSAAAAGYYDLGTVTFTSGVANGLARAIKSWDGTALALNYPLPAAPSSGDTISIKPGCDRQKATCLNKFANLANFAGEPFIPVPETAR